MTYFWNSLKVLTVSTTEMKLSPFIVIGVKSWIEFMSGGFVGFLISAVPSRTC